MKKKLKNILLFSFTGALLWVTLSNLPFEKLKSDWEQTNIFYLILSSIVAVISHILRAERWKLLLKPLGYTTDLLTNFYAVMVGYFINLAIPRGGEVSRCISLFGMKKVPVNTSLGTVVAERVVDLSFLLTLFGISFLVEFEKLYTFFSDLLSKKAKESDSTGISSLTIVGVVALVGVIVIYILWKKGKLNAFIAAALDFLKGLKEGILSIFKLEKRVLFIVHSLLIWISYFLMTYLGFLAVPSTENLSLLACLTLFVAGGVAMSLPLPGGAGTYHAIIPAVLVLYGIKFEDGLSFATIFHLWQTLTIILIGSISLLLSQLKTKQHDTTTQSS
ncbi:MAG: lysylphosphatidylglycerol synthase transmembrane domain-containing protein [Cyclobacteriaceae bacterium]